MFEEMEREFAFEFKVKELMVHANSRERGDKRTMLAGARSERFVVARVFSKNEVELDVVDFVGGLGLESLQNQGEFALGASQFLVVEDGTEASEVDEA
jgi:hypothetical protein